MSDAAPRPTRICTDLWHGGEHSDMSLESGEDRAELASWKRSVLQPDIELEQGEREDDVIVEGRGRGRRRGRLPGLTRPPGADPPRASSPT